MAVGLTNDSAIKVSQIAISAVQGNVITLAGTQSAGREVIP